MLSGRIFQRAVPRAGERRDPVLHHQERELHLLRGSTFKYLFSLVLLNKLIREVSWSGKNGYIKSRLGCFLVGSGYRPILLYKELFVNIFGLS